MRRRFPVKSILVIAAIASSCDEFAMRPDREVEIAPAQDSPWPATMFVQDTDTLLLDVTDSESNDIAGLEVEWSTNDAEILELFALTPETGDFQESLALHLRATVTAHKRGEAVVTVRVDRPGFDPRTESRPIKVEERWIHVSAGHEHTCAITIDDDPYCWGSGLLGNGTTLGSERPIMVTGGAKLRTVTAGERFTCGMLLAGRATCWGRNSFGAIGIGLLGDQLTPVAVDLGQTFESVVAGKRHACGIAQLSDYRAFCWGENLGWQLGDAQLLGQKAEPPFDECALSRNCSLRPRPVRGKGGFPTEIEIVAPGDFHTCGVVTDGQALCWGSGSAVLGSTLHFTTNPELDSFKVTIPSLVPFATDSSTYLSSGSSHTCGITEESSVYCWGFNHHGQLGSRPAGVTCSDGGGGFPACSTEPSLVSGGHRFVNIDAGGETTCGITVDGEVYCWGSNEFGQLGIAPDVTEPQWSWSPIKIELADNPIVVVSVGPRHVCAVAKRGGAYCWGDTTKNRLGTGMQENAATVPPKRVAEPT